VNIAMQSSIVDPILSLPKVELHLHLEGSLRPATLARLAARHGVDLGAAGEHELEARYEFGSFDRFLELFLLGLSLLRDSTDVADAVAALAAELAVQNVRYAEVTTTPYNYEVRGVPMAEYVDGLAEGRRRAREESGVELAWICDIPRELGPAAGDFTADFLTGPSAPEHAVAVGLGGPEPGFPPEPFAGPFDRAAAVGLHRVPHAGETEGPASIRGALDVLRGERIGHGVRCIEDADLLARLVDEQIPLEVSVTSNVCCGVVPDVASHPIRRLLDAGAFVTVNTDDPAYFRTTLVDELRLVRDVHQVDLDGLARLQTRALDASFAPAEVKRLVRRELEAWVTEHGARP
jgi:aminodeoxyfutalosine deaminase